MNAANDNMTIAQLKQDLTSKGEWKHWCKNGKLWSQGFYNDGEREGEWKEWHDNGQLASQGFFKDGILQ